MTGIWPGDIQCVVNLGFDIDGQSSWIGRNPENRNRPVMMTMGDYGPRVGVPRILNLLDEYGLKATFFTPGYTAEQYPELVKEIVGRGHEVSGHGYMHKRPAEISLEEEVEDIDRGLETLEKAAGVKVVGYRSPGEPGKNTASLVAERGLAYDSSLFDDDAPYILETGKGRLVEIPIHWLLDDFSYYAYVPAVDLRGPNRSPVSVAKTWIAEFDGLYKDGRCMALVMHPQLTGHPGRISALERTIRHMLGKPNVGFWKASEIAEHVINTNA